MKYGSEFGAFKITFTMFMLDFNIFLVIESIEKCSDVSFYSVLDVEEVKFSSY